MSLTLSVQMLVGRSSREGVDIYVMMIINTHKVRCETGWSICIVQSHELFLLLRVFNSIKLIKRGYNNLMSVSGEL